MLRKKDRQQYFSVASWIPCYYCSLLWWKKTSKRTINI